jgi:D-3-phosphoglycerate dehydrogenase
MKILVTDKSAEEALQVFRDADHEVTYDEMDPDTLLKEIPKYDALMVRSRTKATTEIVEAGAGGNLKVIGRAGIGVDNIDIETAAKHGIKVVNSPTGSTKSVAELAIAHMLSLVRYIPKADSTMKKGEWIKKQLKGSELNGKTLGLIGSGYIAQHVSKIANCLGMDVLVYSPHCTDEKAKKMGATKKDIEDLLKESDFVSLHIPHTKDSHYLLNDKTLGIMKTGAYLVNVARGGVVDENALFNALKESRLSGAAVDVFEQEPPSSNNKLLSLENVILSPHLGASTKEAQIQAGTVCADQMNIVLSGKDPDFWVNKKFM